VPGHNQHTLYASLFLYTLIIQSQLFGWSSTIKTCNTKYVYLQCTEEINLFLQNSTHKRVKLTIPFNESSLVTEVMCSVPTQHNSLSRKFQDHGTYTDVNCCIPYIALV